MKNLLFIMLISIFSGAQACTTPSTELNQAPSILIASTPTILYATAISSTPDRGANEPARSPGIYRFKLISAIKGDAEKEFSVRGDLDFSGLWDTTFSNHTESKFWSRKSGRLGNIGDCVTTPPPQFVIGRNYVLFIGGPDDSKKFERVDSPKDKWLEYVISNVKNDL